MYKWVDRAVALAGSLPVSKTSRPPRAGGWVNGRMLVFACLVLCLLGWPVYAFLSESLTHGIHDRGGYKEVDLKALGCFAFDPNRAGLGDVPPQYRALDGQKVLLEGEINDRFEADEITAWELVYSIQKCCLGGPPQVQERVYCTAPPGKSFQRGNGYHKVFGTLRVTCKQLRLDDGTLGPVTEVYHIDVERVERS